MRNPRIRDREFGLDDTKSTMRYMHADLLSRSSSTTWIAGPGVAMQAQDDFTGVQCYICRTFWTSQGGLPQIRTRRSEGRITRSSKPSKAEGNPNARYILLRPILTTTENSKIGRPTAATPSSPWTSSNTNLQRRGSRISNEDFRS